MPNSRQLKVLLLGSQQEEEILPLMLNLKRKNYSVLLMETMFLRDYHIRSIYEEEWIGRYVDYDFFILFRLSKETFEKLCSTIVCPELRKPYKGGGVPLTCEKALLITLWWLGTGQPFNAIGDKFNVVASTVYHYTNIVIWRLVNLIPRFIQWPNREEMTIIEEQFHDICGYPGVIGAIDGCNVAFKPPLDQQNSYIDKNDRHSIKIQAVTTARRFFTNINVGFPGSVHDSRMFANSQIYLKVNQNLRKYFPLDEYHLLGDKAYPILGWLLTPFKDYGNITRRERLHNINHSKTRIKVEHTFGIWKGRWRILKYINVNCPKKACNIIAACCVLHNFCYLNLDEWAEDDLLDIEDANDIEEAPIHIHNENIGVRKMENICDLFV